MTSSTWWRNWLGSTPDPDGSFEVGAAAVRAGERRHRVRITSYGTDLAAELVRPDHGDRCAAVVVPFYDAATVFGERTARTRDWPDARLRSSSIGRHLVDRGFAVLAVPWWFQQVADPDATETSLHARYGPPAARHAAELPMTGLGRSIADLILAVDALLSVSGIDPDRVGAMGHSLGAKLALHLAALDDRIAATVAHEPGLGFAHSNWSDPWYLGAHLPTDRDQDDLLRLVAPRPFLWVGGGASDGRHNEDVADRARPAWPDDHGLQALFHDNGHSPPAHVLTACYAWLERHLDQS